MTSPAIDQIRFGNAMPGEIDIISLVAEQLVVEARTVETGRVHISTRVVETEQVVDLPLLRSDVDIERITLNQVVERAVPVREENGVTIVPSYEEVLVVTKQLVLKEELHIRQRTSAQVAKPQQFTLRHEEATITRNPAATSILQSEAVAGQ